MDKKKSKRKGVLPLPWFIVFVVLFVFVFVATLVLTQNMLIYNTVNSVMGGERRVLKSGNPEKYMRYTTDYKSKDDVYNAANALNETICEEGFVLLKNEDNALPLGESNRRVTVFGKNSVDIVTGGSGSNAGSDDSGSVDLFNVLGRDGLFSVNPVMHNYLAGSASGSGRPASPDMGVILSGFPTGEASLPYSDAVKKSYADYHDAAIVVISRIGGEGFDLPRTMRYTGSKYTDFAKATTTVPGARSGDDHYLQLDKNETAMLAEACNNFDNVIVVINSAAPLELGFLDDETHYAYNKNIKAALWIGMPGASGLNALRKILTGEVNPSGRLVDTYSRDFKKDPTWFNFGNYLTADGNRYYTADDKGNRTVRKLAFVEYREGIYFGYRYYETRGLTSGEDWYKQNVVYPFGHGLSYTEFTHTVTAATPSGSTLNKDGKLSFTVEVQNIGDYDGKESVSLYYSAPYISGGIEKAHVVLGDFAKTEKLDKKTGKGVITLTIDVRDMASYDYNDANGNGNIGYELEAGEYTIYIGSDAHCWADENTPSFTYTVASTVSYDKTADGNDINNLFDDVSDHIATYLSRDGDFANFDCLKGAETVEYRTVSTKFVNDAVAIPGDGSSMPWYTSEMPKQSSRTLSESEIEVKLYDLIGLDYDDPLWDTMMDQLTVTQLVSLVRSGNFHSTFIESIDKPLTIDADGPMGFAIFMGSDAVYKTCYYASECVLAATRNKELARAFGNMIGDEGLIGNEAGDGTPYSGWYAPAMNLHRNQFAGRNFEYYSEDGCLSGLIGAEVVVGASEKGVYAFMKHFALNDQETDRDTVNGLLTWANEQSMRETYFKPFEMCVNTGKATAVMSSFNRIGTVWAGGDYRLLTSLLRDEWGFRGMVITDFNVNAYMDADQMIRAGGDLNLIGDKAPKSVSSATGVAAVRRAAKNILYTVANSNAMNGHGDGVVWGFAMPLWEIWVIILCVFFGVATAVIGVFTFVPIKHKKTSNVGIYTDAPSASGATNANMARDSSDDSLTNNIPKGE
ncbi:MAG: glycoside hydrolase family 3 C-terminal domain-containing protein [Clostridiales bacterium]|nr:glycoside hydrolase family 3 C-terminal domain-containing protein [Clostridiales bacterium]